MSITSLGAEEIKAWIHRESIVLPKVMKVGQMAAAKVFKEAIQANAPVGASNTGVAGGSYGKSQGWKAGYLKSQVQIKPTFGGNVVVGYPGKGRSLKPYYALFVAYGTGRHLILAEERSALSTPAGPYTSVISPGTQENPFVDVAFAESNEAALAAWTRSMI